MKHMRVFRSRARVAMAWMLAIATPDATPPRLADPATFRWAMQLPLSEKVVFRGVVNFDQAGVAPVSMMYPAPNAVGLLAGVLTHALISKGSRESQKTRIETEANKVLEPYAPVIDAFRYTELAGRSKAWTLSGTQMPVLQRGAGHPDTWVVVVTPVFSLTQDQTTLVLDNTVALFAPGESKRSSYVNTIRVISDAEADPDPVAHWTANGGELLKDQGGQLLGQSLDIAFADAASPSTTTPFRTIRYMEGTTERMERGQPITEQCDRVLLRSLRGTLMSVPVKASCDDTRRDVLPVAAQGSG